MDNYRHEIYENNTISHPGQVDTSINSIIPLYDTFPADAIGYMSLVGTAWWFLPMILFVKTTLSDPLLQLNGKDSIPIFWWWFNLTSLTDGFLAAAYLSNFIVYFISVIETISWLFFRWHMPEMLMFWE